MFPRSDTKQTLLARTSSGRFGRQTAIQTHSAASFRTDPPRVTSHRKPSSAALQPPQKTGAPSGASFVSIQLRNAGQITRLADHHIDASGAVRVRLALPPGGFAFGGFLEADGGDFVGVFAELGADLVLDALDALVAFVLEGDSFVAGGGVAVGEMEFALFGGAYAGLEVGEGGKGVGGVAGGVALDHF